MPDVDTPTRTTPPLWFAVLYCAIAAAAVLFLLTAVVHELVRGTVFVWSST